MKGDNLRFIRYLMVCVVMALLGVPLFSQGMEAPSVLKLSIGEEMMGSIDAPQRGDWYQVELEDGIPYHITAVETASFNATVALYGIEQSTFIVSDGDPHFIFFVPKKAGVYHVVVSGYRDAVGEYSVLVADATSIMTRVSIDDMMMGNLEGSESGDWFRLYLEEGAIYQFNVEGISTGRGTLEDPYVALYGKQGNFVSSDDDSGVENDPALIYAPDASGSHFVYITGFSPSDEGTYTFSYSSEDFSDVSIGSSIQGDIYEYGEVHWYRVYLEEGQVYGFDVEGASTDRGTLVDPLLLLTASNWTDVDEDDDGGVNLNARILHTPEVSGLYFLMVQGYDGTGTYTLSVFR